MTWFALSWSQSLWSWQGILEGISKSTATHGEDLRSPGEGKGYPLQYSGLENSMDCVVYGVAKSRAQLSDFHFHFQYVKKLKSASLVDKREGPDSLLRPVPLSFPWGGPQGGSCRVQFESQWTKWYFSWILALKSLSKERKKIQKYFLLQLSPVVRVCVNGVVFWYLCRFHGIDLKARWVIAQQGGALCRWLGAWEESFQRITTGPGICAGCVCSCLLFSAL